MEVSEAKRLEALGSENYTLKKVTRRRYTRRFRLETSTRKKVVMPAAQRQAVAHHAEGYGVSERWACRVLSSCRMTMRHEVVRQDALALRERLKELVKIRRRFGYRRLHVFLSRECREVNHQRRFRIHRKEGLHVRRRGGRKRAIGARAPMVLPVTPNQRWSLNFISDRLMDDRLFRIVTDVDDCTRECLALIAVTSLLGARVARELAPLFDACGKPEAVVSDNRAELNLKLDSELSQ